MRETKELAAGSYELMTRIALIVTYLASVATAVILINANSGDGVLALVIWAAASLLLGWGTGRLSFSLLALLAIPFAVPFGYPDHYQYSEPMPVWWAALFWALISACLILASALLKSTLEDRRRQA